LAKLLAKTMVKSQSRRQIDGGGFDRGDRNEIQSPIALII
jgi:hypothetical protein